MDAHMVVSPNYMAGTPSLKQKISAADLHRHAQALQAAVADLVRVYQFRDRDRICCHDVSVTQCHALEMIVEHGPLRLGVLAERLFLDKSTTSRVVSTLVKKGYVEQRADAVDGRAHGAAFNRYRPASMRANHERPGRAATAAAAGPRPRCS